MDGGALPDSSIAQSDPSLASIPNLKALLKESLTEETPSLLKLPTEMSPGEFYLHIPKYGLAGRSHLC